MPPQVALMYPGEIRNPATWSGSPYGLYRGLGEAGAEMHDIVTNPPRAIAYLVVRLARRLHGGSLEGATLGTEFTAARTLTGALALRRKGRLDGVVLMGVASALPSRRPIVTYEDATVVQNERAGDPYVCQATPHGLRTWIERQRRAYHAATACCAGSRWVADSMVADYAVPREKVHVVGFGRNRHPRPAPRDWSSPRFLFVGTDWERKNGALVLECFRRLREEVPSARLDVVGGHPRLDAPGVTGHGALRLTDPDASRRLDSLFEAATCFVMPSRLEAFGIVHLEAGAAGVPSIGTTVGGAADAIGDGGLLVDPQEPGALLDAMRRLAHGDEAARLGALALARAPSYTWRAVAERILRALGLPA